jgi:hypothetical protein
VSDQSFQSLQITDVPGIADSIDLTFDGALNLTLHWATLGASRTDPMRLVFRRPKAFSSHDEMAHPDGDADYPAVGAGSYPNGAYPVLIVNDSLWKASLPAAIAWEYEGCTHYRFISSHHIVDVLAAEPPELPSHGVA